MAPEPEPTSSNNFVVDIFDALIDERRAISRHLHGALTQDLVALSLSLCGLRESGDERLSDAIAHVDRCCRGVRALSYVLAPPSFLNAGLIDTIKWYGEVLRADAGVGFEFDAPDLRSDPPREIDELLFTALQRVAAAAIWQSDGASIHLTLAHERGVLSMRLACSYGSDEPILESPLIRERARSLGGWTCFSAGNGQVLLEISLPWAEAAETG